MLVKQKYIVGNYEAKKKNIEWRMVASSVPQRLNQRSAPVVSLHHTDIKYLSTWM